MKRSLETSVGLPKQCGEGSDGTFVQTDRKIKSWPCLEGNGLHIPHKVPWRDSWKSLVFSSGAWETRNSNAGRRSWAFLLKEYSLYPWWKAWCNTTYYWWLSAGELRGEMTQDSRLKGWGHKLPQRNLNYGVLSLFMNHWKRVGRKGPSGYFFFNSFNFWLVFKDWKVSSQKFRIFRLLALWIMKVMLKVFFSSPYIFLPISFFFFF